MTRKRQAIDQGTRTVFAWGGVRGARVLRALAGILVLAVGARAAHASAVLPGAAPPAARPDSLWTGAEADSLRRVQGLLAGGSFVAADASARRLLASVEGRAGENSLPAALVIDALVAARAEERMAPDSALTTLAERAVRIKEGVLAPDALDLATSLTGLGKVLYLGGDYAAARRPFERALQVRETHLGPDDLAVAESLNLLAIVLKELGDYTAARPLCERALRVREQKLAPEDLAVAESLNNLAVVLKAVGDYTPARQRYQRALTIWQKRRGPNSPEAATGLDNLAALLARTGDFAAARPLYEQALQIREATLGKADLDVARSLARLGNLLVATGDYDGALPHLQRAREIREAKLPAGHSDIAASLADLASLYMARGDRARARSLLEQARTMQEHALGGSHPDLARTLSRLAELHRADGDLAGALALDERALAIRRERLNPDHPDVAASLNDLAVVHVMLGDYARARPEYVQAMSTWAKTLGPNHPDLAKNLNHFAELLLAQGQGRAAAELALQAERIGREHFRASLRVMPEREALAFARVRASGLDVGLSVLDSLPDPESKRPVIDALVHARALVLDEMAARHRMLHANDPVVDSLAADVLAASTRYMNLLVHGPETDHPERYLPLLEQERQDKEAAERALSQRSASFRREQRAKEVGLADVIAALPPRTALVSYVSYRQLAPGQGSPGDRAYLACVLRGGSDPLVVTHVGSEERVDSLIARWRNEAAQGVFRLPARQMTAYRDAGRALRQAIWDPLLPHLAGIDRVFIVPDGAINLVSFATLPLDDGSYLLERGPLLHYVSAERDLVTLDSLGTAGSGLLVVGGPAFDARVGAAAPPRRKEPLPPAAQPVATFRGARSNCGDFAAVRFPPLPDALGEVKEIGQLWRDAERKPPAAGAPSAVGAAGPVLELTGSRASERAFKEDAPGNEVLHIATHGFFFTGHCTSDLDANSLVLSGLALAGANERERASPNEEDGILTAEEIAALDLTGCDWAVLSACDTGVGEIRAGEGVFGLRRAFAVAGARTLIMSLWSVDDASTRTWMRALYGARYQGGLATAEAVRAASRAVLEARRARGQSTHPFYWGGFVAAGDWR